MVVNDVLVKFGATYMFKFESSNNNGGLSH
jgi:hypothetical protein